MAGAAGPTRLGARRAFRCDDSVVAGTRIPSKLEVGISEEAFTVDIIGRVDELAHGQPLGHVVRCELGKLDRTRVGVAFGEAVGEHVCVACDLDTLALVPDLYHAFVARFAGAVAQEHALTDEGGIDLQRQGPPT